MDNQFAKVRRQKHIWQIAFIILVLAIFMQTFILYKDNPRVANKIKSVFSCDSSSRLEVEGFLQGGAARTNTIEMNEITRPSQAAR